MTAFLIVVGVALAGMVAVAVMVAVGEDMWMSEFLRWWLPRLWKKITTTKGGLSCNECGRKLTKEELRLFVCDNCSCPRGYNYR